MSTSGPGRPPKPGARTETVSVKVSKEDLELIRNSGQTPSAWLAQAIAERLYQQVPARGAGGSGAQCPPHPKARILKGLCRACGTYVGPGR